MSAAATKQAEQDEKLDGPKKNRSGVVDYLSAPKKKRKNFVVLALGPKFDADLARAMGMFCKSQFPKHSVAVPKKKEELLRQVTRNISLLVIDDQFLSAQELADTVKEIKVKKNDVGVPILFLTSDSEKLIQLYHKSLFETQNLDDYIDIESASRANIFSRIKYGVDYKFQRRSKRFRMEIPVRFEVYNAEKAFEGSLVDLSMHGALLKVNEGHVFKKSDQIRVSIPLLFALKGSKEEILRLSAKVRRIDITGNTVAVSWEAVSEEKANILSKFLFTIFEKFLVKAGANMRAKVNRVPMPVGRPT